MKSTARRSWLIDSPEERDSGSAGASLAGALKIVGLGVALALAGSTLAVPGDGALAAGGQVTAGAEDPRLAEAESQLAELQARIDELAAEITRLRSERDRLARTLEGVSELYVPLEADRLLLLELRKELPDGRAEAEAQLNRMRRLALSADPVRLGPIANRVMETAPDYLDWRDQEFATSEDAAREFVESGAGGFQTNFTNFRNAILLTISNRLDGLLNQLDRIR